ncbi:MAG: beta-N-acetylhexosaminidase [Thermoanaerobaculia bacterium]
MASPLAAALLLSSQAALPPAPVAVVPRPVRLERGEGTFVLGPATRLRADASLRRTAELLQEELRRATGWPFPLLDGAARAVPASPEIRLRIDRSLASLGPEGYRLTSTPRGVEIAAPAAAGAFYGVQTLRQLLPPQLFRRAVTPGVRWEVPAVRVEDRPRFSWRGSHLDVARHFMPKRAVLDHIDLMALHKLNVFHWHLTDDQGWRLEIRKYPRLVEVGSRRRESQLGRDEEKGDGTPHGGFYTQDDVREVVRYAAERFVTVVPEIEMPGHAQAILAAYPELGNTTDPVEVWTRWGISERVLSVDDRTIAFLTDVLAEVVDLFPSPFVHVGGDEVPPREWNESPAARARMRETGARDAEELHSWLMGRVGAFLASKGRRLVGWDEILDGGPAVPGAVVMSWRRAKSGLDAVRAGHDVVMAPMSHTYLDYYQSKEPGEPLAIGGFLPLETVYAFEPVPPELEGGDRASCVLGAQAQLWTEFMATPEAVQYMAWPRLAALAEVVWSPREARDLADFRARLAPHLARLDALGVSYRGGGSGKPPGFDIPGGGRYVRRPF